MHIAFYSDTFVPQINGVARVVKELADELSSRGHMVTVCAPAGPDNLVTKPRRIKRRMGTYPVIKFSSAHLPTYKEQRVVLPSVVKSLWWIKQSRPDVIHVHTPFGMGWEAAAVSKMTGIPLIGTLHTFYMDYLKHVHLGGRMIKPLTSRFEPTFFNRCLLITSPSDSLAKELKARGVYRPLVRLINPVKIDNFFVTKRLRHQARQELLGPGTTRQAVANLVYVGRVSYEKNLAALIDIVAPILRHDKKVRFFVVGGGPVLSSLEAKVNRLNLTGQIKFAGIQRGEQLKKYLAAGDIFITASLTENQPISIIEAMAAGLPVVAYGARGIPEVVKDRQTGLLAEPGSAEHFRTLLTNLILDSRQKQVLADNALIAARQYQRDRVTDHLLDLYQDLGSGKYV